MNFIESHFISLKSYCKMLIKHYNQSFIYVNIVV